MRERPGGKWREGRGGIGIGMGQGGYRAAILYSTLYLYSIYYCGDDLHGLDHLAGSQTTGSTSLAFLLLAHPHATPNRLEFVVGLGSKPAATELTYKRHDMSDQPRFCTPHRSVRPPAGKTDRTSTKQRACGHASHLFRAEASRGFTSSSRDYLK